MKKLLLLLIITSITKETFAQPTITSFSPTAGSFGTTVIITGNNFNAIPSNNIVFFGATKATVSASTSTTLTLTVPSGATFQYISVTDLANNLTAYSTKPFIVTFACGGIIDTTSFALKADSATGSVPNSIAIGDIDGDGKSDLVITNQTSNTVSILKNTSSGGTISFSVKTDYATGNQPFCATIGDIDGDGKPDLAIAINNNGGQGKFSVYKNISTIGTISFSPKVDFLTGANPQSLSISDLDGDGKPDVAVSNYTPNSVSVFLNTSTIGTVSFASKVDFTTGVNPISLTIGDLNGDNKPDIAVTNFNSTLGTISILKNTSTIGTISFAPKADFTIGLSPYGISLGDLDGDGKSDLAIANSANNTGPFVVSILRNTSTSGIISFAPKVNLIIGGLSRSIAISDLDGDGKLDLATVSASVSLLKNNSTSGTISFASKVDFAGSSPRGVSIGDIDGDGKPDIATANYSSGSTSIYRNHVNSTFMTSSSTSAIYSGGTFNIPLTSNVASNFTWLAGNNTNTIGESITLQTTNNLSNTILNTSTYDQTVIYIVTPTAVSNGCIGPPQTVNVLVALHPPTIISFTPISGPIGTTVTITGTNFSTIPTDNIVFFGATQAIVSSSNSSSLIVSVPSGANYQYISVTNLSTHLTAYTNQPFIVTFPCADIIDTSSFAPKVDLALGIYPSRFDIGDLDGDGKSDLAVPNFGLSTVSVFRNLSTSGTISFAPKVDFITGEGPGDITIGDLDGDGKPDLAIVNVVSNSVSILINTSSNGNISFAQKVDFISGGESKSISIGDLNDDGKPELVVGNNINGSGTFSIFKNISTNGIISYSKIIDFAIFGVPNSISIGDLNGDGKPDISVNYSSGHIGAFKNTGSNGSFSFTPSINFATGSTSNSIQMGDLDGDGKPELATANDGGSISILRNISSIGVITFDAKIDYEMAWNTQPFSISIGDLDGDGKPDLAVTNHDSYNYNKNVSIFHNISTIGTIAFDPRIDFTAGTNPNCIRISDLDGDGKPDLTLTVTDDMTVSILRNLQCKTSGIFENEHPSTLTICPNPFNFQTSLVFNVEQKQVIIKITDVFGKEVKTISLTGKQLTIEKGDMKKGVYFLQIIDENKNVVNRKIIVQ